MSRPGSESGAKIWDGFSRNLGGPVFDLPTVASGTGLDRGQARAELSAAWERTLERIGGSGEAKNISDSVIGAGSRSALIVLKTLGNAARVDPVEGSGAS